MKAVALAVLVLALAGCGSPGQPVTFVLEKTASVTGPWFLWHRDVAGSWVRVRGYMSEEDCDSVAVPLKNKGGVYDCNTLAAESR